tara:strand:- start:380 stop:616 length:237 start_codon:yes stop_codon:yes gene_type:complete
MTNQEREINQAIVKKTFLIASKNAGSGVSSLACYLLSDYCSLDSNNLAIIAGLEMFKKYGPNGYFKNHFEDINKPLSN